MRAREFVSENASAGATSAGSMATVAGGLGHMPLVSRMTQPPKTHKYQMNQQARKSKRNKNVSELS